MIRPCHPKDKHSRLHYDCFVCGRCSEDNAKMFPFTLYSPDDDTNLEKICPSCTTNALRILKEEFGETGSGVVRE